MKQRRLAPETSGIRRGIRKRRKLKNIAILPSLVTLMNGICGFAAIVLSSYGLASTWEPRIFPHANISFFALAGYMIFLGMIADVMDGHVARISNSTSSFGAQLDSLCDVVSFGVAPAFLMMKLVGTYSLSLRMSANDFILIPERAVHLIAIIYVLCTIIRLARFNVETKNDDDHLGFVGLPSPPAAGIIVSMVVLQQDFLPRIKMWQDVSTDGIIAAFTWILPLVTLLAGILMVTRIPYPHVVKRLFGGKKRFSIFLLILFVLPLVIWNIQLAMALGFCIFVLYGVIRWLFIITFFRKKKSGETENPIERNLGGGI